MLPKLFNHFSIGRLINTFKRLLVKTICHQMKQNLKVMGLGQKLGQFFVAQVGSAIFGLGLDLENFPLN